MIFRTLMATRATRLSAEHVQALNGIELTFYGGGKKEKKVLEAWKAYHDHLNTKYEGTAANEWTIRWIWAELLRSRQAFSGRQRMGCEPG